MKKSSDAKASLKKGSSRILVDPPKTPKKSRAGPNPPGAPKTRTDVEIKERTVNVDNVDSDHSIEVVSVTFKNGKMNPAELCEAILPDSPAPESPKPRTQVAGEFIPRSSAAFKQKFKNRLGRRRMLKVALKMVLKTTARYFLWRSSTQSSPNRR